MEDFIFQNGKWFPPWRVSFSKMENGFPHGGFRFPKWKMVSSMEGFVFQNGKWFPPWRVSFSKMESRFPHEKSIKSTFNYQFHARIIHDSPLILNYSSEKDVHHFELCYLRGRHLPKS